MSAGSRSRLALLCRLLLLGCLACQAPIRTVDIGPERTYHDLNSNILNAGTLSADTHWVLFRRDLEETYERDPIEAIRALHAFAIERPLGAVLFSLAEISYASAERGFGREGYLASAVYAYLYLFGTDPSLAASPYDRRFRVACDLYNYGLLKAFLSEDGRRFLLRSGTYALPVGKLEIEATRPGFAWPAEVCDEFIPADNLRVIGFSSRRRDAGLGVPLIAVLGKKFLVDRPDLHVPSRTNVASTAFLRLPGGLAELEHGAPATLELYSAFDVPTAKVGDRSVPLEADITAPLAFQLGTSRVWSFELSSFFSGSEWQKDTGIWMLQPYQKGKIPVVFVHGTASSPGRWAEMFNQLNGDQDLRAAYQFWFFTYTTGNPIVYSASLLRNALTHAVSELDPEGQDPALRNMVVIGHSQGGLLTKMQAIHSGERFWENVERSSDLTRNLSAEDRQALREMLVFDPQPSVKRVVFVSTPQHGSELSDHWLVRLFNGFIGIPSQVRNVMSNPTTSPDVVKKLEEQIPTSVENMSPKNPFLKALASIDVAEGIHSHSIISVKGEGPLEDLDDGAVDYKSAHIDTVESEVVVQSGHSCQGNPRTIQEVRRILVEHLRASAKPGS